MSSQHRPINIKAISDASRTLGDAGAHGIRAVDRVESAAGQYGRGCLENLRLSDTRERIRHRVDRFGPLAPAGISARHRKTHSQGWSSPRSGRTPMSFHILLGQLLCVNAIAEAPAFFPVLILLPSVVIGLRRRRAALENHRQRKVATISECRFRWLHIPPATTFVITHSPSRSNRRDGFSFSGKSGAGRRSRSGFVRATRFIQSEGWMSALDRTSREAVLSRAHGE